MRYDDKLQGFPEEGLKRAQLGCEVLEVSEHFFTHGNVPHLSLVMSLDGTMENDSAGGGKADWRTRRANRPDYYLLMPDERKELFTKIREWRKEQAAGKFPPYVVARNSIIAELAFKVPKTMTALRAVEGCGDAFCEKYGESLLTIMKESDLEPGEMTEEIVKAKTDDGD